MQPRAAAQANLSLNTVGGYAIPGTPSDHVGGITGPLVLGVTVACLVIILGPLSAT